MSALQKEFESAIRNLIPEIVEGVVAKLKTEGAVHGEEWSRQEAIDYLKANGVPGCDSARITYYKEKGWLRKTPRSRGRKDFFYSSDVKSLKRKSKAA